MELTLGIILLVLAVALVVLVLFQSGKEKNLSGSIAGGAETFFGKTKGSDISKKLSVITTVLAVVFVLMVIAMYLLI
jgi:preprotein translocase subunit SecG